MRANEFTTEAKRKPREPGVGDTTPHDYNPGWENLNWLKEQALITGERLAKRGFQLFVPRQHSGATSARDKRLANLTRPYAYDDEGEIKPNYASWEAPRKDLPGTGPWEVKEGAPILTPGRVESPPGNNKPSATLWTSTARKGRGGWASDWSRWVSDNQPTWMAPTGFLYKLAPGALILTINSDQEAEAIYYAFANLGRTKLPEPDQYYSGMNLTSGFPWDQISRHFDGVWHGGYGGYGGGYEGDSRFMYGWDVESTAWFNTSYLTLVGEVPVVRRDDESE